jgi:heat-inducible transcriptional repressor
MPTRNDHDRLDDRKAAILRSVVTGYVETAQPVGSSQVARDPVIEVSPATVRADMAALEREGYLTHPHTSAGRIPTDKGYRFFVDHLGNPHPLARAEHEQVQTFFSKAHGELERVLQDTSRLLAQLTDCAGVVVSPAYQALVVRSALIARLSTHTAMAVVVLSNGVVEKRTVSVRDDVPDSVLSAASTALQQRLSGSSLGLVPAEMPSGDAEVDELVRTCVAALEDGWASGGDDQVFVGGAAYMAERFDAIDQVRAVLGILEQSYVVVTLLRDVLAHGQSVSIGSEHADIQSLAECSLVVAPYESDGVALGTIGVLGPTRMDYEHALAGERLTRELRRG